MELSDVGPARIITSTETKERRVEAMREMTKVDTQRNYTDEQGIRYFSSYNGSRVNYPAGTRFSDGYVQPSVAGVAASESTGVSRRGGANGRG